MRFFLKYLAPILAILWLAQVHPLGAMVAIVVCVLRCAFQSRVFAHLFAHFVYDVLKGLTVGIARLFFRRRDG